MPFQAGTNRASAVGSTGSTSARSAASDRRRSSRSTSASTNSAPPVAAGAPPVDGRRAQRPELALRQASGADQAAQRVGHHRDPRGRDGPPAPPPGTARGCGRTGRRSRPSGSGTGSSSDSAMPGGRAVPRASRSSAASAGSAQYCSPPIRTCDGAPGAAPARRARPPTSGTALRRSTSTVVSGPENAQQIGDLVRRAGPPVLGEALQLGLGVGDAPAGRAGRAARDRRRGRATRPAGSGRR